MKHGQVCMILFTIVLISARVSGFVRLVDPPQRSSLWRYGFRGAPVNFKDGELNCGGFEYQWHQQEGCCGLCGDPCDGPRENEAGGKYARGIIAGSYVTGRSMKVKIDLWPSQQLGYFEFRLCNRASPLTPLTRECLDENILFIKDVGDRQFYPGSVNGSITLTLHLPASVTCDHCVLQLKYNTGYRHGDEDCPFRGCGPQEQFYNCADIRITETSSQKSTDTTSANTIGESLATVTPVTVTEELAMSSSGNHYLSLETATAIVNDGTPSASGLEHHVVTVSNIHQTSVKVPATEPTQLSHVNSWPNPHSVKSVIGQAEAANQRGTGNMKQPVADHKVKQVHIPDIGTVSESVSANTRTSSIGSSSQSGATTTPGNSYHSSASSVHLEPQSSRGSSSVGVTESPALVQYPSKYIAASAMHLSELGLNVNGRFVHASVIRPPPFSSTALRSDGTVSVMWTRPQGGLSLTGYQVPVLNAISMSSSGRVNQGPVLPKADANTSTGQVSSSSSVQAVSNEPKNEQVGSEPPTDQTLFSTGQETILPLANSDPVSKHNGPQPSSPRTNVQEQAQPSSTTNQATTVVSETLSGPGHNVSVSSSVSEPVLQKVSSGTGKVSTYQTQSSLGTNEETVVPVASIDSSSTSAHSDPLSSFPSTNARQQAQLSSTTNQATMVKSQARPTSGHHVPVSSSGHVPVLSLLQEISRRPMNEHVVSEASFGTNQETVLPIASTDPGLISTHNHPLSSFQQTQLSTKTNQATTVKSETRPTSGLHVLVSPSEQIPSLSLLQEVASGPKNDHVVSDTSTHQTHSHFRTNQENVLPIATTNTGSKLGNNSPLTKSSQAQISSTNTKGLFNSSSTTNEETAVKSEILPTPGYHTPVPSSISEPVNKILSDLGNPVPGASSLSDNSSTIPASSITNPENLPNEALSQSVSVMFEATGHPTDNNVVVESQNKSADELIPVTTLLNVSLSENPETSTSPDLPSEVTSPNTASLVMETATQGTPKSSSKFQKGLTKTITGDMTLVSQGQVVKIAKKAKSASDTSLSSLLKGDSATGEHLLQDIVSTTPRSTFPNDPTQELENGSAAVALTGTSSSVTANLASSSPATPSTAAPAPSSAVEPMASSLPIDESLSCKPSSPEFRCHSTYATENWCIKNCRMGFCPLMFCSCSCTTGNGFQVQRPHGPKCVSVVMPKYDQWCDAFHSMSRFCHPRYCKMTHPGAG